MTQPGEQQKTPAFRSPADTTIYFALTLDPIHVGTGGYRLGRVDNSIVREPGTNLPKIPGTSLSGVCRANAAMATGRYAWSTKKIGREGSQIDIPGSCAGQGQSSEERDKNPGKAGHCGSPYCPVCVTFGFARGDRGGFQGLAQFSDARVLFFPVHSLTGPVWITCPSVLQELPDEHRLEVSVADDAIKLAPGLHAAHNRLNLGWLMLECEQESFDISNGSLSTIPDQVRERTVLVSNKLFSRVVNDNLEVRTSVSINPDTGAAEDGALFTYEAIPRGTILWFPVTYGNPAFFRINDQQPAPKEYNTQGEPADNTSITVRAVVEQGLRLLEHLGVGGMNTRGMGRMRLLNQVIEERSSYDNRDSQP